ncbi:MAG TPA: electron transport complex subunit RsxD, partial [Acholeplasmataceae bacterium]|nr:electron transport complex subunit RsxD [Acholeplasmataceae bacterium]
QLFAGGLLFGVVFMITDPVTSPVTRPGRWIYGLMVGALVVLIRLFGAYPEGFAFALLFSNMFVPLIDYPKWA